jgi:phosphomannomutase
MFQNKYLKYKTKYLNLFKQNGGAAVSHEQQDTHKCEKCNSMEPAKQACDECNKTLVLFDVDGTLTEPMQPIKEDIINKIIALNKKGIVVGFVGGSNYAKQQQQLQGVLDLFTWKFTENGLYSLYEDKLFHQNKLIDKFGEENYKTIVNTCLKVISETDVPQRRSHFVELRTGMINISPIGRSCSHEERKRFFEFDKATSCRKNMIKRLSKELEQFDLNYSIGGEISIDIFPRGWDKTYCLQFVEHKYKDIHFFGDRTAPGGNDYEIFNHPRVKGHTVVDVNDTIRQLTDIFGL